MFTGTKASNELLVATTDVHLLFYGELTFHVDGFQVCSI